MGKTPWQSVAQDKSRKKKSRDPENHETPEESQNTHR